MFIRTPIDLCTFLVNQRQTEQHTEVPAADDLHDFEKQSLGKRV